VWDGPPGEPMLEVCGSWFRCQDIVFQLGSAGTGIRLTANNRVGATSQNPVIDSCSFVGPLDPNDSVAIHVTGENLDDQVDRAIVRDTNMSTVGTGLLQTSQQSALTVVQSCNLSTWHRGIELLNGSLIVQASTFNDRQSLRDESYRAIRVGRIPDTWYAGHQLKASDNHFETSQGGVLDIDHDLGSFMSNFTENNVSMQRHEPGEIVVCRSTAAGPTFARGNTVGLAGKEGDQTPVVEGNVIWWDALNFVRPQVKAALVRR
jgi:hypothetical protein